MIDLHTDATRRQGRITRDPAAGLANLETRMARLEARPPGQHGGALPHPTDLAKLAADVEKDDSGINSCSRDRRA
jgi:hypothetical protein